MRRSDMDKQKNRNERSGRADQVFNGENVDSNEEQASNESECVSQNKRRKKKSHSGKGKTGQGKITKHDDQVASLGPRHVPHADLKDYNTKNKTKKKEKRCLPGGGQKDEAIIEVHVDNGTAFNPDHIRHSTAVERTSNKKKKRKKKRKTGEENENEDNFDPLLGMNSSHVINTGETKDKKKRNPGEESKRESNVEEQFDTAALIHLNNAPNEEESLASSLVGALPVRRRQAIRRDVLYEDNKRRSTYLKVNTSSAPALPRDDDTPVFLKAKLSPPEDMSWSKNEPFLDEPNGEDCTTKENNTKRRSRREQLLRQEGMLELKIQKASKKNISMKTKTRNSRRTTSEKEDESGKDLLDTVVVVDNSNIVPNTEPPASPVEAFSVRRTHGSDWGTAHSDLSLMLSVAPHEVGTPMILEAQLARPIDDIEAGMSRRKQEHGEEMHRLQTKVQELRRSQLTNLPLVHAEVAKGIQHRKRVMVICVALVFLAILGAAVGAIVSTQKRTESPSNSPTVRTDVVLNGTWSQVGNVQTGKNAEDYFGTSVSLSRDARVMAVGATQYCSKGDSRGYASVYQLDESTQSWISMGQVLSGNANQDVFGRSVSLNRDGTILAVGAPQKGECNGKSGAGYVRVYEYNVVTEMWGQLGSDISGETGGDELGFYVSLSDTGDTLVVGARRADTSNGINSGLVRAFRYNRGTSSWEQLGQTISGQAAFDMFGVDVALDSSGSILAVGARSNDLGGKNAGQVSIYKYNATSAMWLPMGEPIIGKTGDLFGYSVSLSQSGLIVAASGTKVNEERVVVYAYNNETSQWMQRGQTLETQQPGDRFGHYVSLNGEGNVLAVGSRFHNASGVTESGQVVMLKYDVDTDAWKYLGEGLNGDTEEERFGNSVSLSGNGTLAIGSSLSDPNGASSGSVYVFQMIH